MSELLITTGLRFDSTKSKDPNSSTRKKIAYKNRAEKDLGNLEKEKVDAGIKKIVSANLFFINFFNLLGKIIN